MCVYVCVCWLFFVKKQRWVVSYFLGRVPPEQAYGGTFMASIHHHSSSGRQNTAKHTTREGLRVSSDMQMDVVRFMSVTDGGFVQLPKNMASLSELVRTLAPREEEDGGGDVADGGRVPDVCCLLRLRWPWVMEDTDTKCS